MEKFDIREWKENAPKLIKESSEIRQTQRFVGRKLVKVDGNEDKVTLVFDDGKKLTITGNYGEGITIEAS